MTSYQTRDVIVSITVDVGQKTGKCAYCSAEFYYCKHSNIISAVSGYKGIWTNN